MRTCDGKACYSKNHVREVMRHVQRKRKKRLRSYTCHKCYMEHLTSVTNDL